MYQLLNNLLSCMEIRKSSSVDTLEENRKYCKNCKFAHEFTYGGTFCYRDQRFKTDPVSGQRVYIGKKLRCGIERQQSPNLIVSLYRKITGHVACGPEGKFWAKYIGSGRVLV